MKTFILPEAIRKGLLDYLMTRPLGEVYDGFNALVRLEEIPQSAEPETDTPTETPLDEVDSA